MVINFLLFKMKDHQRINLNQKLKEDFIELLQKVKNFTEKFIEKNLIFLESMRNAEDGDISTDEDEEEKKFRLDRIKGKTPEEIEALTKTKKKLYTIMFNIFQVFNI